MHVQPQAYSYIIETYIIETDIFLHTCMQILSSFHTLHKPASVTELYFHATNSSPLKNLLGTLL